MWYLKNTEPFGRLLLLKSLAKFIYFSLAFLP